MPTTAPLFPPTPTQRPTIAPTSIPTATPDLRPLIDSPAWFNTAIAYQIFPRSFYDASGDGIGDVNGIRAKLDYIQSLGVDTIWITPHYPSTTYHGYDVVDYKAVNPQFGTLDDFKGLVADLHARKMHLIIDFVGNHSSNAHPFFKDAYRNPSSKYTSWYEFSDPQNKNYASFFGVAELPEWNWSNPEVRAYLVDAANFWLDLGVDGLRCDYVLGVAPSFWNDFRKQIKARHAQAVILGEVWDGSALKLDEYFKNGFDALFDFPWYLSFAGNADIVGSGAINQRAPVSSLNSAQLVTQRRYPRGAQLVRFVNNHDTNRVASVVNGNDAQMRLAAASLLLSPGIPIMYYGEEIGMRGIKGRGPIYDEYRREPMDWFAAEAGAGMPTWFKPADRSNKANDGISVEEQDKATPSLLNFYRHLAQLRRAHSSLQGADFEIVETPECDTCISMLRRAGSEMAWLTFNFGDAPVELNRPPIAPSAKPTLSENATLDSAKLKLDAWGWALQIWAR